MMLTSAAVFVKSPGLSAVKTRLAASLGAEAATTFYRLSCAAIEEVLGQTGCLDRAYWALAEAAAGELACWGGMPHVMQGEGQLGERLHQIYSSLTGAGRAAILLGADAPQISPTLLAEVVQLLQDGRFVVGPARDGGFYLFAGSRPIPREIWTRVTYSQNSTLEQLCSGLKGGEPISFLSPLQDVDTLSDLLALRENWRPATDLLPAQQHLQRWCMQF